jgi:hypothetical protein
LVNPPDDWFKPPKPSNSARIAATPLPVKSGKPRVLADFPRPSPLLVAAFQDDDDKKKKSPRDSDDDDDDSNDD